MRQQATRRVAAVVVFMWSGEDMHARSSWAGRNAARPWGRWLGDAERRRRYHRRRPAATARRRQRYSDVMAWKPLIQRIDGTSPRVLFCLRIATNVAGDRAQPPGFKYLLGYVDAGRRRRTVKNE